jgi:hypothetical protein
MPTFAVRLSNVVFWVSIVATALLIGAVSFGVAESLTATPTRSSSPAIILGLISTIALNAFWVIIQYLITGTVKVLNKTIVSGLIVLAIVIGGIAGVSSELAAKANRERYAAEEARKAKTQSDKENAEINNAFKHCKDKFDFFLTTAIDKDYQLTKDLYEIYYKCMKENNYELNKWSNEVFEHPDVNNFKRIN